MKTLISTLILGAGLVLGGCGDKEIEKECEEYAKNPKYLCGIVENKGTLNGSDLSLNDGSHYLLLKTNFKTDSSTFVIVNDLSDYAYDIISKGDTINLRLRNFQKPGQREYVYPGSFILKCALDNEIIAEINSKKPIDYKQWKNQNKK